MVAKARTGIVAGVSVLALFGFTLIAAFLTTSTEKPDTPAPQRRPVAMPLPVAAETPQPPRAAKRGSSNDEPEPPRPPRSYRSRPELPVLTELPGDGGAASPPAESARPPAVSVPRRGAPRADDTADTGFADEKKEASAKSTKLNTVDQGYVNRLNAFRTLARQRPVTVDPELSEGCIAHARYLVAHHGSAATAGLGVHAENPALAGFTKFGDLAAHRSVITEYGTNLPGLPDRGWPLTALDLWMSTLYHRVPMLDPDLTRIGIGYARNEIATAWYVVMDVASGRDTEGTEGRSSTKAVVYPGDGQTDVPRRFGWGSLELPNPLPIGYKPENAGYPITVSFLRASSVTDVTAALRRESEESEPSSKPEEIPFWLSTPEQPASNADQQGTICLIAAKRFRERATYRVTVAATVDGRKWEKTWKFTTGRMK